MGPIATDDLITFLFLSPVWLGLLLAFREGRRLRYLGRPLFRSWRTMGTVEEHVPVRLPDGQIMQSAVISFTSEWGSTARYIEPPLRRGKPPAVGTEVRVCHKFGDESVAKRYDRARQVTGWLVMVISGLLLAILSAPYWPVAGAGAGVLLLVAVWRRLTGRASSTVRSVYFDVADTNRSGSAATPEFADIGPSDTEPSGMSEAPRAAPTAPAASSSQPYTASQRMPPRFTRPHSDHAEIQRVSNLAKSLTPALRNYGLIMFALALLAGTLQGPVIAPIVLLVFLLVGFFILWQAQPFPDGTITTGIVVDHVASKGRKGRTVYANVIEFETDAGCTRFSPSTSSSRRTPIGTERTVSYRPYDLSQARCTNGLDMQMGWIWTVFTAAMGLAFNWMVWPPLALIAAGGAWHLHRRYIKLLQPTPTSMQSTPAPLIS